jgi:biopolymer transport protein ExbD
MGITTPEKDSGVFAEINITPLTDIFLVLLIIFMVTTAVTIESAAHVNLPKANQPTQNEKPKGIIVTYTAQHQIYVGDKNVTLTELPTTLSQQLAPLAPADKIVIFQGDPKVLLGDMVHILDIAKTAGANAIAIAVAALPPGAGGGGGGAPGGGGA